MSLSLMQKKLLKLLSINCRFTNKDVASVLSVSEDTVKYQIDKLIPTYATPYVQFDYQMIGYEHHHIWISLASLNYDKSALSAIPQITSINTSIGAYDLQIILVAKTTKEKNFVISQIKTILKIEKLHQAKFIGFKRNFTSVITPLQVDCIVPTNKKNISYKLSQLEHPPIQEGVYKIDNTDKKILLAILNDPMASYSQWSRSSTINVETIRYRLKRYIDAGFIRAFSILHNFSAYDLITGYVLCDCEYNDRALEGIPEVFYSAKLAGKYNTIIYICARSHSDFLRITSFIRNKNTMTNVQLLLFDAVEKYKQLPQNIL